MPDAWDDIGSGIVYQPSTLQGSDLAKIPGRPTKKSDIQKFIKRRHPEFGWFVETSRWILDTLEGGEQYRDARYGTDRFGKEVRNLVRSRREYPLGGIAELDWWGDLPPPDSPSRREIAEYNRACDDEYELRRRRTPIPHFLDEYIEKILSNIYQQEITRNLPVVVERWAKDVDGRGSTLAEFMRNTLGRLLIALGHVDVYADHPPAPAAEPIETRGDQVRAGLASCMVRYILPENMLWWRLDGASRYYTEALVKEYTFDKNDDSIVVRIRHWTSGDWVLWDADGEEVARGEHSYGIVPIVRVFDRRRLRLDHTGQPRLYPIVDLSKVFYNEESELVASDTTHNFPILQGPPVQNRPGEQQSVFLSRFAMLTRQPDSNGTLNGYDFVQPSTNNAEFMQSRQADLRDRMDMVVGLNRPMGAVEKGHVSQSGISKAFDQDDASKMFASIAASLSDAEWEVAVLAARVLTDGKFSKQEIDKIEIIYPNRFNLLKFDDLAGMSDTIQKYVDSPSFAKIPELDRRTLRTMYRGIHPDLNEDTYAKIDKQIDDLISQAVESRKSAPKVPGPGIAGPTGGPRVAGVAGANQQVAATARQQGTPALDESINVSTSEPN
jgi:hypothetical protein